MLTVNIIKSNTHKLFMGIALFLAFNLKAQTNLVPNPSFEEYIACPANSLGIYFAKTSKPDYWYKPDLRNAQYFNKCSNKQPIDGIPYNRLGGGISYQYPNIGDAYFSMFYDNGTTNSYNYVQVKLFDSLKSNTYYYAEYYLSLCNTSNVGCNNQAMLFTKSPVYADTINYTCFLSANPQIFSYSNPIITDTMGWVKVSGIFKAKGGEQYLTLGNFKTHSNTQRKTIQTGFYNGAGYYVDDVAVYALDSFNLKADAGKDTTINIGDSVFIGSYTNGIDSLQWLQNGLLKIDSTRPGFWVHPLVGTCYVLTQTVNEFTSSDTVCVTVKPLPLKFISYSLRQAQGDSPSSLRGTKQSVENIWQTGNEINVSHFNIQRSLNGRDFITIGKVTAQNKSTNNYEFTDDLKTNDQDPKTFYYRIESIDKDGKKQYSEIRTIHLKPQTLNGFSIYPNPAKDVVTVECKEAKELLFIDCWGRTILQLNNITEHQTINTKQLPKGLYLLKVTTIKGEVKSEKLLVE